MPSTKPSGPRKPVPSRASSQPPATPGRNIASPIAVMRETHTIASPIGELRGRSLIPPE